MSIDKTNCCKTHTKEKEDFGENVYGYTKDDKKYFPIMKEKYFEVSTKDGEEIIVDEEGNIYPDMEVPQFGTGRTLTWGSSTPEYVEFDPKTRLGVGGEALRQEFDVHSVVQDSLWNVYNQLDE